MNCPYWGIEMILGNLRSASDYAVYWLPKGVDRSFFFLNRKNIEDRGGIVLDQISKVGFAAKGHPVSYYCESCKVFVTKL